MRVRVLNVETQSEVREFSLEDSTARTGECLIGRSPDLSLVLESPDVSRLHGKFVNQNGQYTYYDLGSANGSLVNGKLAVANQPYPLRPNDIVRIGEFTLMLREVESLLEDLSLTVMSSPDATVVGNSWQFLGLSAIATEEPALQTPDDTPEPVLSVTSNEESIAPVSEIAVESPALVEIDEMNTVSTTDSTSPVETDEAEVDQELLAALAAISDTTEENDIASNESEDDESEDDIGSSPVETWEAAPVNEDAPLSVTLFEAESIAEPIEPITESVVEPTELTAEPTTELAEPTTELAESTDGSKGFAIAGDPTVIQLADLVESDAAMNSEPVNSEPAVAQTIEEVDFADEVADEATVVQPTNLSETAAEATVEQPMLEAVDDAIAPSSVPVSEPTATQSMEEVAAVPAFASEPDATILQGVTAESVEELLIESASEAYSPDALSQKDSIAVETPQPLTETEIGTVVESDTDGTESDVEPITEAVPESIAEPIHEPISEPITNPVSEIPTFIETVNPIPIIAADSEAPVSVDQELPQPFSDRYIALLCHDSQLAEMTQFVERHSAFLSQCLTISTPFISQSLASVGLEISQQTPAVPTGGYQTVNSLITSDKVLAVIFLRDFFTPQPTQANDEALTRSCNVYQVLLANNLPTAEAIAHYLKNVLAGSVVL
ncbi:FHA domain-containing protein [Phormidium tenue FACHB-886]|nr:FHA domain-containing protein [Phormidium tenue FACHB-886]